MTEREGGGSSSPAVKLVAGVFADQWQRLLHALADAGTHVQSDARAQSPPMQAQSVRYMMRIFHGMQLTALELDDPDYPKLVRMFDTYLPYPNSNPDCVYFFGRIDPRHSYRIFGRAGSARVLEVQCMSGQFPAGPNHRSLGTLTTLHGAPDGTIEIVLSATPHAGNWLPLQPEAAWIYVRQYYYDWETETPADLAIERIGASYPPPVITGAELQARVDRIIGWIPTWYAHLRSRVGTYYAAPADACQFAASTAGMDDMHYGKGHFALAGGECMILEFRPPPCTYWSFQIMNDFWETMVFDMRQSSLNGHQAALDADGVFRAVISVDDPGVANWLDPVGGATGLICARVLRPASPPQVSLRRVALRDLRAALSPATPWLTPEQRSEALRRRMLATVRRYRE